MRHTTLAAVVVLLGAALTTALADGGRSEDDTRLTAAEEAFAKRLAGRGEDLDAYLEALGEHHVNRDLDAGFGGRRLALRLHEGRFTAMVSVAAHRDRVAAVAIQVFAAGEPAGLAAELAVASGGLVESEGQAHGAWTVAAAVDAWAKERRKALGDGPPIEISEVPREQRDAWTTLVSPTEWYPVGTTFGYAGLPPDGFAAARVLVEAKAHHLLSAALRGANPEGRVEAALALLVLEKQGVEISDADRRAIDVIRRSDVPIEHCAGCIVHDGVAAEAFEQD